MSDDNIVKLRRTLTSHDGSAWKTAADCIRELLRDIETGTIEPTVIHVAIEAPDADDPEVLVFPSYTWGCVGHTHLVGLLTKHIHAVLHD